MGRSRARGHRPPGRRRPRGPATPPPSPRIRPHRCPAGVLLLQSQVGHPAHLQSKQLVQSQMGHPCSQRIGSCSP
eukprot:1549526-Lingulodinium_polyedra.AAC.1